MLQSQSKSCYKQFTTSVARVRHLQAGRKNEHAGASCRSGGCHVDIVTIAVVGIIVVSYLVGSLTSSVETEQELPHRY